MVIVDAIQIAQYITVALLFAIVVTGAWKKSFTNTVNVVVKVVFISMIIMGCVEWGVVLLVSVDVFTTMRAILHQKNDEVLRGIY